MKLAVYEQGGLQEDTIYYWRERFGDRCTVVTSGTAWVDFIPFDTNKAKGVEKYQETEKDKKELERLMKQFKMATQQRADQLEASIKALGGR